MAKSQKITRGEVNPYKGKKLKNSERDFFCDVKMNLYGLKSLSLNSTEEAKKGLF